MNNTIEACILQIQNLSEALFCVGRFGFYANVQQIICLNSVINSIWMSLSALSVYRQNYFKKELLKWTLTFLIINNWQLVKWQLCELAKESWFSFDAQINHLIGHERVVLIRKHCANTRIRKPHKIHHRHNLLYIGYHNEPQ